MKNAWNVAVAACVSGAIGYFVGLQMHSGGAVGTPLRAGFHREKTDLDRPGLRASRA